MRRYHILLVEDETEIRTFVRNRLLSEGYRVSEAETVRAAEHILKKEQPDLIVLDIMLPDGSGLELCRDLRGITKAPILFVTSLGDKNQIVQGLRAGADDYMVKPFDADELVARIEVQLRRAERFWSDGADYRAEDVPFLYGSTNGKHRGLSLEPKEQKARWEGKDLTLSPKEYRILSVLCRNRNRFTTAEELYSEVWGMSAGQDVRTVKVHISGLRRKLRLEAGEYAPELIHEKDRGYRLEFTGK